MIWPSRHTIRLSCDDALVLWRAREVHRVQSVLTGFVLLVFLGEVCSFLLLGLWVQGLILVSLQWVLWRGLRAALRWVRHQMRRPFP